MTTSTPTDTTPNLRKIAKLHISMQEISQLLDLPAGVQPMTMYGSSDPPGVVLLVHSDEFPEVPADCYLPLLFGAVRAEVIEYKGRRFVHRFSMQTAAELAKHLEGQLRR